MNPLSRILQCLKPPQKPSWHIFINPNPRELSWYLCLAGPEKGQQDYQMKLARNPDMERIFSQHSMISFSSNHNSRTIRLHQKLVPPSQPEDTEWVRIVDTGQKNVDGKTLREILIDILEKFPSYDLLSEEGVTQASQDIEASLSPVASFREMRRDVGAWSEHKDANFGR